MTDREVVRALQSLAERYGTCGPGEFSTRDWWAEARAILEDADDAQREALPECSCETDPATDYVIRWNVNCPVHGAETDEARDPGQCKHCGRYADEHGDWSPIGCDNFELLR